MATLRTHLSQHGFQEVQTYIQTGNVLLQTKFSKEKVRSIVSDIIKDNMGADIVVFVLEKKELQAMLEGNPFKKDHPSRIFYTVLNEPPSEERKEALLQEDFYPEKLALTSNKAYMFIPGSAARSRLSNNFLENKLGVSATTRNENTLKKLLQLFDQK